MRATQSGCREMINMLSEFLQTDLLHAAAQKFVVLD
jgi:hypothetical protein